MLKHYKLATLYPVEHSMTPHDVWDRWIELQGHSLDAFYPVVDTEIGRLAVLMANEGSYPENARGLAMNGAEVVYRASYPHPHTGNEFFEIQNRARALDNNFYVLAPHMATYYLDASADLPIDTFGGRSIIVDYKGRVVGRHDYGAGSSYVAGTIDIEALRDHRTRAHWDNWMKGLSMKSPSTRRISISTTPRTIAPISGARSSTGKLRRWSSAIFGRRRPDTETQSPRSESENVMRAQHASP